MHLLTIIIPNRVLLMSLFASNATNHRMLAFSNNSATRFSFGKQRKKYVEK
jgi:hypothetical protein